MKHLVLSLVLILSTFAVADVRFLKGPFPDALSRASAEHKPILIDFYTDWCRWCDTLDARTYSDSAVFTFINRSVIPVKIDAEKGEGVELAKKYAVKGFPTVLLITVGGEEIDRLIGYMPKDEFLPKLKEYVAGKNTLAAVRAQVAATPNDPATRYAAAKKFSSRMEIGPAQENWSELLRLDPKNTLGHNEEASIELATIQLQTQRTTAPLLAFINEYPSSEKIPMAYQMLWQFSFRSGDTANARSYFARYIELKPEDAASMNAFAWMCAEKKLYLEYATTIASRAVGLAKDDGTRAMYLDTQAAAEFAQGHVERAVALEQQALGLLRGATEKDRKPYEETLARFKAAQKAPPRQ
jgi:thioredoxin-related protein